jgi:hypothetical protein
MDGRRSGRALGAEVWAHAPLSGARRKVEEGWRTREGPAAIHLAPDYGADVPLWGPWEPLELSEALLARLARWQEAFETHHHYLRGWDSEASRDRWQAGGLGLGLGRDLRAEVAGWAEVTVGFY